jgi:hypothetical protein
VLSDAGVRYEVRARSFGEILDLGFRIVRDHFGVLLGLSATLYVPMGLLGAALQSAAADSPSGGLIGTVVLLGVFVLLASPLVSMAVTYAVGEVFLGRRVGVGEALRYALSIIVPMLGTALLASLAIALGFLLLIVPGVYLMLSFLLLWQVGVLERRFGTRAMSRSRELMRGNLGRGLGIVVVSGLIVGVVNGGLQLLLGVVPYLGVIGSSLAQALGTAYTAAVSVVLYFDIRCRKEAFDIEHLAQAVQAAARAEPRAPLVP